jgi:P27 family predicted phage terminase small subunit
MSGKKPPAPKHLSAEMQTFWRKIVADYVLSPEHLQILKVTCEQYDRAAAARERIERDGMVLDGKRHPLIGVEAKSTEIFLRGIRDLGLLEQLDNAAES